MDEAAGGNVSIVAALAVHEKVQLDRIAAAREQAENIVSVARAEAERLLRDACRAVSSELERLRSDAEEERQRTHEAALDAAGKSLEDLRTHAEGKAPQFAAEMLTRIIPTQAQEDSA